MLGRSAIFALLTVLTALACHYSPTAQNGTASGVVMQLPATLQGYASRMEEATAVEKQMLPDDTEFAKAVYFTPINNDAQRDVVHCSIVLSGAERRSIHRPEVCLVGQGWTIMGSHVIPVDLGAGRVLTVKDLYIEKPVTLKNGERRPVRAHYVYWFVGADVTTPSHTERIWLTLWDNLTRNVNHRWAYPSLMALVTDNFTTDESGERCRSNQQTVDMLVKLIQQLVPKFQKEFMEHGAE